MRAAVCAFAVGVMVLQTRPELPDWPWLMGAGGWLLGGLVILPAVWAGQRWYVRLIGVLLCGVIGFGYAAWRAELRLADALPTAWEGRDVALVGVVASMPQGFSQGHRFVLEVERVLTPEAQIPEQILLSWYQGQRDGEQFTPQPIRAGERWQLVVRLKRPHGNANPQAFDYEAWLLERGIRATGYVRPQPARRLDTMVWRLDTAIERIRQAVRDRFLSDLPSEEYPWVGVLAALAVGDQRAIQGDLWPIFNRTGTTHLMSISGLHVTMLAALAGWLVGGLWRRIPWLALRWPAQKAALPAGCLAALLYTGLAGFGVPAQRTCVMLLVAALALLGNRLLAVSRVWCLALLAVLILDPWAVLAPGFWLSFGAVGALLLAGQQPSGRGWRAALKAWGLAQWVATLASLPVLLLVFQQFSLVSPLANAVAIPVVSFLVTPLALLAALCAWWPLLALAHGVLDGLMRFLVWCAQAPVWQVPAPPEWVAALAVLGVLLLLLPRSVPGRWLGLGLLLPALWWPVARPEPGAAWVTVLDVGQGLAVLVRTHRHTLLYDPGPLYSAESDAGQRVVVPYLRTLGIDRLDQMIITHRDSDHAGGTASVLAAVPVGRVLGSVSGVQQRCADGQSWVWDDVRFAFLHPLPGQDLSGKSNHASCVLQITAQGGGRMLLTSDIEAEDEAELLHRHAAVLPSDVLLVPHHGSRTSSSEAFLAAVGAPAAIIPVGYRNRFGHPKPDVLARYQARGTQLWRTDRDGAVLVELAETVRLAGWRQVRRRYWQQRDG